MKLRRSGTPHRRSQSQFHLKTQPSETTSEGTSATAASPFEPVSRCFLFTIKSGVSGDTFFQLQFGEDIYFSPALAASTITGDLGFTAALAVTYVSPTVLNVQFVAPVISFIEIGAPPNGVVSQADLAPACEHEEPISS
jgi:hypothetical protein